MESSFRTTTNSGVGQPFKASHSKERPVLVLNHQAAKRRARLHPWVFSNEVAQAPAVAPGTIVRVESADRRRCWTAYYNPHSLIAARILASGDVDIDATWLATRLREAIVLRERLAYPRTAQRLVHGEGDGLPGLVVDRYGSVLVMQSLTAGMDQLLPAVTEQLVVLLNPACIYARCDADARRLEQLVSWSDVTYGQLPESIVVDVYGVRLSVDVAGGQKTGLFLDQAENTQAISRFAPGARVLDVCCYTGAVALALARAGARHVLAVDISRAALDAARENSRQNGIDTIEFQEGDAFAILPRLRDQGESFDIVHLDPPAFAPRRRDVPQALRGYRELNRRALRLVRSGGIFATSTCSHHITPEMFLEMLRLAARDAERHVRILETRGQAADHPQLLAAPETRYLTCVIAQVC